jgi:GNAT superfamily N-acetyltransferase
MVFRKADSNDVMDLVNLRQQQLLEENLKEGRNDEKNIDYELNEYFSRNITNNTFISWVALDNSEIIATSGLCFYQLPPTYSNPSGKVAYITNMYTRNEYRRKGIATTLFEKIINEAKLLNYKILRLHTSLDGKSIYKKFGFIDSEGFMHIKINN